MTQATLPVVIDPNVNSTAVGGSLSAYQAGSWSAAAAGGSLTVFQDVLAWRATLATLPVIASILGTVPVSGTFFQATQPVSGTVTANQGTNPWQVSMATLPVVANINNTSIPVTESGTWTVQPGNTPNTTAWLVTLGTLPITGSLNVAGQATVTAIQGDPGTKAWPITLATLPVVASGTVTANAGTNLNTSLLALESGGNLASIVSKLDVTLGSRLASGGTLPVTGTLNTLNAGGSLTSYQGGNWTVLPGNTPNTTPWLVTMATLPIVGSISVTPQVTVSAIQGDPGTKAWLATLATLPVVANINNASIPVTESGTWTVQPGNTPNTTPWLVTMATLPIVGSISVTPQVTVTAIQGDAGSKAWPMTLATLPVVASGTVTANAGTNLNTSLLALESGGNLASILAKLDVSLGSRLASGGTLPVTGTLGALNAGGSLTAYQGLAGTQAWLVTQATLPVMANITNATLAVTESGTWTVQPGNTPNTTAWLITQATLPVVASGTINALNAGGSVTNFQGGAWNVFSSLASGTNVAAGGKYMPTLLSLADQAQSLLKLDLFNNLMVNTNVPLPNSTKLNRFYTLASMASLMAAPGAGKRLVIRELDFSGNATLSVKLVEDQGGTPATVWGPHYFLPYAGVTKTNAYIPITANKSLGVDMQPGGFNASIDLRVETENV